MKLSQSDSDGIWLGPQSGSARGPARGPARGLARGPPFGAASKYFYLYFRLCCAAASQLNGAPYQTTLVLSGGLFLLKFKSWSRFLLLNL